MSRSRSSQPTISLFSFQDIITSVTAILILLVLILSLELVTRTAAAAARDPGSTTRAMAAAVADMELVVDALEADLAARQSQVVRVPGVDAARTARILREQIERMRQQLADSRTVEREAERIAGSRVKDLREAEQDVEGVAAIRQEAEAVAAAAQAMEVENDRRREEIEAKKQTAGASDRGGEVVFTRDSPSGTRPWLLDVAADGVAAVRLGTGKPDRFGTEVGAGSLLDRWIASLDSSHDHVLVLVRPSGVELSAEVSQRLRDRGVPFGVDLIREDAVVRDGAATAEDAAATKGMP